MQNIDLICVGKLNAKYFAEGVAEYQKRLAAFASFRIIELPEEKIEEKNASDAVVKKALDKEGKNRIHCFAHHVGEPVTGIVNLDRHMVSLLTVEAVRDCELISISADCLRELVQSCQEIALACNRMIGINVIRNMEYEKVITSSRVEDRYRYFLEIYPDLVEKVSKKDIASYLNMTPESLSRLLKNMKKENSEQ